ncbi:MAG: nitroreductase family protein [Fusobacteriaceae bacterium]|jgi:hypothetical protein|nr:nitroreductase family protein [Fusobacteriaceae bacterium]
MIQRKLFCFGILFLFFTITQSLRADVKLPDPLKNGGTGIFTLLEQRASGTRNAFPTGKISDTELATILWAATGLNRSGKGWTVPMGQGKKPYVKIYAVRPDGAYYYDWNTHTLKTITDKNIMKEINNDGFVQSSPVVLIFVSDPSEMGAMARFNEGNAVASILTGAMTQDIYLAADSLGISARYMVSLNEDKIKNAFGLKEGEVPLCIMPLGKR